MAVAGIGIRSRRVTALALLLLGLVIGWIMRGFKSTAPKS